MFIKQLSALLAAISLLLMTTHTVNASTGNPTACHDIDTLKGLAIAGGLSGSQTECLEKRLSSNETRNQKIAISNVLIDNSKRKGNWKDLVQRHLSQYDATDADLVFAYAMYHYRHQQYDDVLVWLDKSLQLTSPANEPGQKQKLYLIHQLRTLCAQKIWRSAENSVLKRQSPANLHAVKEAQSKALATSLEWLHYADDSAQDTAMARQLCISAADPSVCSQR